MKKNQANANVGKYIIHGSYEAEWDSEYEVRKKLSKWIEHLDSGHVPATIDSDSEGQPYLKLKNHYHISIPDAQCMVYLHTFTHIYPPNYPNVGK